MNIDKPLFDEVSKYLKRLSINEIKLSTFGSTLKHKNADNGLTDGVIGVLANDDNTLSYRIINLMVNEEYLEHQENVSVETKLLILGMVEYSNNTCDI